jgi:DNA-binding CsgD family transcriptional regulator
VRSDWPLVGRADELAFVAELFRAGDGARGVVLAGPVGVGKTRLAQEVLARCRRGGWPVRWVAATAADRGRSLGPFAALLGPSDRADPGRLVEHAVTRLAPPGGGEPLLGVDDAHLLDDLSATLLHQLVTRARARVVVTVRVGEPAPAAVTSLWKDGYLARLEVPPLSRSATAELVERVLRGPVETTTTARLWTITQGNPRYLRLLVRGEREAGRLAATAGRWRWTGRPALTPGLLELVEARMGVLERSMLEVLDVLALAGSVPADVLGRLVDPDAVERAEGRGLVEVLGGDTGFQVKLGHPLFADVRRARCDPGRARRLRGRIATLLAEHRTEPVGLASSRAGGRATSDAEVFRRAVLTLESDLPPDPELYTRGALRAANTGDTLLATRLAEAAVAAGGGPRARLTLGYALCLAGRGERANSVFAEVGERAEHEAERSLAALSRAANLFWPMARPRDAELVLDATLRTLTEPGAVTELTALRAVFEAHLGRTRNVPALTAQVLAAPRASSLARSMALWAELMARGAQGRLTGLAELVQEMDPLDESFATSQIRTGGLAVVWPRALRLGGLFTEAEQVPRRFHRLLSGHAGQARVISGVIAGNQALAVGQVRTAARWFQDAADIVERADPGGWTARVLLGLTQSLALAGEVTEARRALTALLAARHPGFGYLEPEVVLARAWVAASEGATGQGQALAQRAARLASVGDQPAVEAWALHTAVLFGDPDPADRLAELATHLDGPFAPAAATHAAALAAGDPAGLLAAAHRFEELGGRLLAADAAAQAVTAYRASGDTGRAQSASAYAQRLGQACEGARTPALVALAAPLPLTSREREIVKLAAEGLTNRQIAARLTVSVRTVEGHLYRASAKLGVSDRGQLAALLE